MPSSSLDTLSSIPGLMKTLDTENQALNGKSFNEEVKNLVSSIAEPVKGLLSTNTTNNINADSNALAEKQEASASDNNSDV